MVRGSSVQDIRGRLVYLSIAVLFCASAFAAVPSQGVVAADPVVLIVGTAGGVTSLNPFHAIGSTDLLMMDLMYDSMTDVQSDFTPGPRLAESW